MKKNTFLCLLFGFLIIMACSKMDDYKKYTTGKEILYSGKADSLVAFPGKNRIQLSWQLVSDPKTTKARIYWRNKADSMEVPITRGDGIDKVDVILDNMEEGSYSFEVVTFHEDGTKSVPSFVNGKVYGDKYSQTLLDRALLGIETPANNRVRLKWGNASDTTMVGVEVEYKSTDGTTKTLEVKNADTEIILEEYFRPSSFKYRTVFIPSAVAIDKFYTSYETATPVFEVLIPKPYGDITLDNDAVLTPTTANLQKPHLWNDDWPTVFGQYGSYRTMLTADPRKEPLHITFDLKVKAKLSRMRLNHYHGYTGTGIRKYEIWGHPGPPAQDGSWDGWILLAKHENIKPSGPGPATDEDKAAWLAGDNITFPGDIPSMRYIRIRGIENWSGAFNFNIAEVTFWAFE